MELLPDFALKPADLKNVRVRSFQLLASLPSQADRPWPAVACGMDVEAQWVLPKRMESALYCAVGELPLSVHKPHGAAKRSVLQRLLRATTRKVTTRRT